MATSEQYAQWIVNNADKKGTPEFDTVAQAYQASKEQSNVSSFEQGQYKSALEKDRNPLSVLGQSAIKGVVGLGDVVAGFPSNVSKLYNAATTDEPLGQMSQPIRNSLIRSGLLKAENEPNTPALKAMDFTAQLGTGGGLNPLTIGKTLLPSLARLGAQGLAGSAAQQFMESSGVENPLIKAIGTGLSMGAAGLPTALRTTVGDVARNSLKNVTPDQINAAQQLMNQAQRLGTPLTAAEAIAQVTGGNRLTSTQRIIENSPKSAQTMADFMNQRPAANKTAFSNIANEISPFVTKTPLDLSRTAENFINRSEKGLTSGVNPYYQSGIGEMKNLSANKALPVLPIEVKQLAKNPSIDDAINHVINNKYSGVTGFSPNSPDTLLSAKKYLDAQYTKFTNKNTESFDKDKAKNAYSASRELDDFLASKSESYSRGRDIYSNAQTNTIEPRKQGMLGQLADNTGTTEGMMAKQSGILMPPSPYATTPADIKTTVKLLRREDPNVVKDWTRQNLQGIFNETNKKLQSGENQTGGAKFASAIAGNDLQRENLKTLISTSASPQAWKGFETMLDIFEAQGKRLSTGSATAFNQPAIEELKGGGFVKAALSPFKPSNIVNTYDQFKLGFNTKKLAELLTDPNGIKKLEELSKTKPSSAKREVLTNSLAGSIIGGKDQIEEQ
jgi:hypothetical protein